MMVCKKYLRQVLDEISFFEFIPGWIDKAFILPMIKSHFTDVHNLTDQQVSFLLSTKSFNTMVNK